jgi:hypothetical protein
MRVPALLRYALGPVGVCAWVVYLLTCPVVAEPTSFGITEAKSSSAVINVGLTQGRIFIKGYHADPDIRVVKNFFVLCEQLRKR